MKISFVNMTISKLLGLNEKEHLLFNHPIQRKGGQWDLLGKSLLIHSQLDDYPVPPIFSTLDKIDGENGKPVTIFQVIDGKQRLLNIFDFINGEYSLHDETPSIDADGIEMELGGLMFGDLSKELQEKIMGFSFVHFKVDEATDDELEEMFFRLNNGVALSKDQKTKAKLGIKLAKKMDIYLESEFIKQCSFTASQLRKADDMAALLQGMMLIDNYDYDNFSGDAIMKFAIETKNRALSEASCANEIGDSVETKENETDKLLNSVTDILEYLSSVTSEIALIEDEKRTKRIRKYLKKINIPMLMKTAEVAINKNIAPEDFLAWYETFFDMYKPGGFYGQYCAAGSVKKENVIGRVNTMVSNFNDYIVGIETSGKIEQEGPNASENEPNLGEHESIEYADFRQENDGNIIVLDM